jgi:hypothetical protein
MFVLICNFGKQNISHEATTVHADAWLALNMEACANYRSSNAGSTCQHPALSRRIFVTIHKTQFYDWRTQNVHLTFNLHLLTLLHCYHEFWCHVWGQGQYTLNGGPGQYAL